jgi:AraC-like DNA-binding protein
MGSSFRPDQNEKCLMNTASLNHLLTENDRLRDLPGPNKLLSPANHGRPCRRSKNVTSSEIALADWEALAIQASFRPEQMAALRHITLRHLERLFHQQFNKTPSSWIRELRCRRVIEMLAGGYSNKWIAFELKFSNPSHLCHEFKKVYGTSPRAFMRPQSGL